MDGYEAARIIRTRLDLPALPIIAMTAGTGGAEEASLAGMNDYVAKPFDPEELVATVRAVAAGGEAREAPPGPETAGEDQSSLFADLPGIDLRAALVRLGGDRRLWFSLMRQFEGSQGEAVAQARRQLSAGLDDEAARAMHCLRGVAANLGAIAVARLAGELERSLKDKQKADLPAQLAALQEAMAALFDLARRLPEPAWEAQPAVGGADLRASLEKLQESLLAHNLDAIAEFENLRPVLQGAVASEATRGLAAAIESLDFATATGLVINILAEVNKGIRG
jgi:two-component system, sensor histidine kinase and response regulator